MSRTRAVALALVNWKGVFYERYLLDRHVTALEGANGSGKTTVMIAAYVVLLPDMSRLRFTNLGETGATGGDKGIWGRLGEAGRPSYVVLEFSLEGQRRLIAGVQLERKGEPSVDPTPFIISGLEDKVRLQDLLLLPQGDSEVVPELQELRETSARLGGRLQVFPSAREYFATLFEQGVLPMRMGIDEERNKFNEMLRTSMTGGISRALTSELRGFLLKEENGLADTLQRMKANLDACRRTRTEVQESRRLEQEIGDVFNAGQAMFTAAFLAVRERADELERRVAEAQRLYAEATQAYAHAEQALVVTEGELEAAEVQLIETSHLLTQAKDWFVRMRDAVAAVQALNHCREVLEAAEVEAAQALEQRQHAEDIFERRREERHRAQNDYEIAVQGQIDLEAGIGELYRRAGAYRQATLRLKEVQELLAVQAIVVAEFDGWQVHSRHELEAVDRERRTLTTRLADAEDHRQRHGVAMAALLAVVGEIPIVATEAYQVAGDVLSRYRDELVLAERLPSIARAIESQRPLVEHQARARLLADQLAIVWPIESAAQTIRSLLSGVEAERSVYEQNSRDAQQILQSTQAEMQNMEVRQFELNALEPLWREHAARALQISEHLGVQLINRADLNSARIALDKELSEIRDIEAATQIEHERLIHESRMLLTSGGPFPTELLRLRDQIGADLLAANFDDVGLHEAAVLEARLGPLSQALVVDDPEEVAKRLHQRSQSLVDVLLISRDANLESWLLASELDVGNDSDVIVSEGMALRVSRVPERPRLGRRAREVRAQELRAEAEVRALALDALHSKRSFLERLVDEGNQLLAEHGLWLSEDPALTKVALRQRIVAAEVLSESLRTKVLSYDQAVQALVSRLEGLRTLLSDAFMLEESDHAERLAELEDEQRDALTAQQVTARNKPSVDIIERDMTVLRQLPLETDEVERLRLRVAGLQGQRERLMSAIESLDFLVANSHALDWSDAPLRLEVEQALLPALKAQLDEAKSAQTAAEVAENDAQKLHGVATEHCQLANLAWQTALRDNATAISRFEALAIPSPSVAALGEAEKEVERIDEALKAQNDNRDTLVESIGKQKNIVETAQQRMNSMSEKLASERREADPAITRWEHLQEMVAANGLKAGIQSSSEQFNEERGSPNLRQRAQAFRILLLERLRHAQGGDALVKQFEQQENADATSDDVHLDLWLTVRNWLRHRLPAQIAEVDDPRESLRRLREQLSGLEERLMRQESDLRGASEDVARGIDVQVRKARGQVNRLNQRLEGVSFGSIQSIRVRLSPVERMENVLHALRDGAAQQLLFQENMPIEDALVEIFQRYGGSKSGGQRLLDYREYVHLQVEIRRMAGSDWEVANPTRLSTGEAIGVGAALMIVILSEWERDANLLRGRRSHGSLRFLFLDEANRLDPDNLGVLFDLCQTLDLQLLIAAPEVARVEGNTTYRLVRDITPDGREEVRVTGRRTRADS
ncbi:MULTISPECIES: chromosome partition protein MukB [unclassified Pseudomonas]|uniref:chromosome partition protein MukB n=1 Tax=unclassified Pseudomonas TaxID=196821 RepID=UPI000CD25507|nr:MULTISPECIES: chromosome partition protein MukB [unclassified Pseudomonas]POA33371.1 chromosome partition protein MukB [Pseudomonas sp. GW456-R21]POA61213.1 chromosome partition protein MukB [Pseudomonas sp. GW460-R15]